MQESKKRFEVGPFFKFSWVQKNRVGTIYDLSKKNKNKNII